MYEKLGVTIPPLRRNCKHMKAWTRSVFLLSLIGTVAGFWSGGEGESDPREVMSPVEEKGKEKVAPGSQPKHWLSTGPGAVVLCSKFSFPSSRWRAQHLYAVLSEKFRDTVKISSIARSCYSSFHRFPFQTKTLAWGRAKKLSEREKPRMMGTSLMAMRHYVDSRPRTCKFWPVFPVLCRKRSWYFQSPRAFTPRILFPLLGGTIPEVIQSQFFLSLRTLRPWDGRRAASSHRPAGGETPPDPVPRSPGSSPLSRLTSPTMLPPFRCFVNMFPIGRNMPICVI